LIIFYVFIPVYTFADDVCSKYKFNVDVNVKNKTEYNPIIKSSAENMVGKLGETLYQTAYESKILLINIPVKNGYCVSLRSVDININVPEFVINIDKRLKPNTCAYKIVLAHEKDHVNVNKNVMNKNIDNLKKAVSNAANSIKPVFVSDINNNDSVQQDIQQQIESYTEVKNMKEKIQQEMEKNNEDIDTRGDSFEIWKCDDFYKEMKKFGDKISID
jgi:hypothetical protein